MTRELITEISNAIRSEINSRIFEYDQSMMPNKPTVVIRKLILNIQINYASGGGSSVNVRAR